jgi:hypothetical protein
VKKTKKSASLVLMLATAWLLLSSTLFAVDGLQSSDGALPQVLEAMPDRLYQVLGPVGAGAKEISEARQQIAREAKKMNADAVIQVRCEPGGMRRDGLTWYREAAYCRGMAIRYQDSASQSPNPISPEHPIVVW